MTVNMPSAQSVRIGGHVYQVNVSQAQVDARNIDRERARQLSRETARRRRALEDRRQQIELREERKRQTELAKRREKQREATERYQRAHIPHRRRFSSPVLDKAYSAPALAAETNLHSLSDTRFQTGQIRPKSSLVNRTEVEQHTARTAQSRAAFKDQFQPPRQPAAVFTNPSPPAYPRPTTVKTAWDSETQTGRNLDQSEEQSESGEEDENSTFIVEENFVEKTEIIDRSSTPKKDSVKVNNLTPQPPDGPKPVAQAVNPRNAKILNKYVEFQKAQQEEQKRYEEEIIKTVENFITAPQATQINQNFQKPPVEKNEAELAKNPVEIEKPRVFKGILKRRVTRRIVSANGNRGIIAASIRDSLELAGKGTEPGNRAKTVRWEKLYYDDGSVAEFATDGKPRAVAEKSKKSKTNRRVPIKKAQMKPATPPGEKPPAKGKKGKKKGKVEKPETPSGDSSGPMQYRHTAYTVAPTPSSGTVFKTENPQYKPDFNHVMSSRIPMPPTVARPLTSRTQIFRSKRIVSTTNPIKAPPNKGEPNYVVNSNNQLNIHIGSVELSPELNRTPTDNDITWLWDRVRTVLENQQKTSKRHRPSSTIPKSSRAPTFTKSRPHSAHVGSSTAAFALAEQLARRGARDEQIMEVIGQPAQTQLSLEEQQIEQSLQRLDDRLLHIQETAGFNGIAFHNRH